jgi:solute carrier family 27 fatty acid transporter 1/4
MFGNGLRPDIWVEFVRRFAIPQVGEFYGSTEGNANVVNFSNQAGACGFISQILPAFLTDILYPVSLVKMDEDSGRPVRVASGRCVRCRPGDCGEFVGRIALKDATRAFDGYAADASASAAKVLRNVYRTGDAYFSSGDLLELDRYGFVYFRQRTGDTFRWKGENVSTLQVESVVYTLVSCKDCAVYGVSIPGCEGKAGMVAIGGLEVELDMREFLQKLRKSLDIYAWPVFVRITNRIDTTSTMKISKVRLQSLGFQPLPEDEDLLYYLNRSTGEYLSLTDKIYQQIQSGSISF